MYLGIQTNNLMLFVIQLYLLLANLHHKLTGCLCVSVKTMQQVGSQELQWHRRQIHTFKGTMALSGLAIGIERERGRVWNFHLSVAAFPGQTFQAAVAGCLVILP